MIPPLSHFKNLSAFFIIFFLLSGNSSADDFVGPFYLRKQQEKSKGRWSLSEWIDQRDRMRMMDLWLNLHSPSPYEFFLGGNLQFGKNQTGESYKGGALQLAAFVHIFGLEIQKEFQSPASRWLALFHLRVFGLHYQATHLGLQGGLKDENNSGLWSAFSGVSATIYITKYFGIDGLYRYYFTREGRGNGHRAEGGAFLDFSFLRLGGSYLFDTTPVEHSAVSMGIKIFF